MRISGLLLLAIPFVSATVLNVASRDDSQITLNPSIPAENLRSPLDVTVPTTDETPETNAQRLARGLSPLSPKSVHGHATTHRRPTRVHAARAGPSSTSLAGVLQVTKTDGTALGFVATAFNKYGEYGVTDQVTDALPVSATIPTDGTNFDIVNGSPEQQSVYPVVGLTNGFASTSDDMSASSFNYAYLTGVQPSQPKSSNLSSSSPNSFTTATSIDKISESIVWTYDASTGNIKATWYNTDGGSVPLYLFLYTPDNVIVASGSTDQFASAFGADNVSAITMKVVTPGV